MPIAPLWARYRGTNTAKALFAPCGLVTIINLYALHADLRKAPLDLLARVINAPGHAFYFVESVRNRTVRIEADQIRTAPFVVWPAPLQLKPSISLF